MARYTTKQRKLLTDFLSSHADECLSPAQIARALAGEGVSVSAVYRNLSTLEEEGAVQRVPRAGSREVYYRFVSPEACAGCIHLSCRKCGRMFHMNHAGADALIRNVEESDAFELDRTETVLYGVCATCKKA